MAIKSIKLKLYFSKQNKDHELIWHTHELLNAGVAYYSRHLLLLRQQPILDIITPQEDLLRVARTAQAANGRTAVGTDEEILRVLKKLYEEIVPSSVGAKANVQVLARAFLSPLVDPKSIAGLGVAKKKKEKDKDTSTNTVLIEAKNKYGILPLFRSFSDTLSWEKRAVCTTWDRDMFQQAIERLASWESWNIRVMNEYQKLLQKAEKIRVTFFDPMPDWAERLLQYETERKAELNMIAMPSDAPYRIRKSGIRGWRELRQTWMEEPSKTKETLMSHLIEAQNDLRGEFGDPTTFSFLARPENHFIWACAADNLTRYIEYNEALEKLGRAKQQAQLTLPDAFRHPVWVRLDGPGGNLQSYTVSETGTSTYATITVLACEDGMIKDKRITVPIAQSAQWKAIQITGHDHIPANALSSIKQQKNDTKVQWVMWRDRGTNHTFYGKLGGAKIQFERADLTRSKYYYDTYINISINYIAAVTDDLTKSFTLVKPDETSPWTIVDFKPEIFEQARWVAKQVPGVDGLTEGLRVMSVSLKLRSLAVCSIFEVVRESSKMAIPIAGTSWLAEHKSSFIIRLPGEKETPSIAQKRREIVQERIALKNKLKKLSRILALASKPKEAREEHLRIFRKSDFNDEAILIERINSCIHAEQEQWQQHILAIHREIEHDLGKEIEQWRKKYRRKSAELHNICGLSVWWIQELSETRKLINAWSAHARQPKEIVRARSSRGERKDRKAREVDLDVRLLRHISHIKDDRTKKGADAIVMHALGYVYNGAKLRYTAQHPPCRIILFHDISGLRMDRSQSRRDNARLMAWAHRAIPRHVASQGEIYGIQVGIVRSTSTTQWHAHHGTPALRVLRITDDHFDQLWFAKGLTNEMRKRKYITTRERKSILELSRTERIKKLKQMVRVGQLVPWESSDDLATKTDRVIITNSSINGAQMLQRLFWSRQMVIVKLWCVGSDETGWVPLSVGKRVETALGFGKLVLDGDKHTYVAMNKKEYLKMLGQRTDEGEDGNGETEMTVESDNQAKKMFFRDPTGTFFPADAWQPLEKFWRQVENLLDAHCRPSILSAVSKNDL